MKKIILSVLLCVMLTGCIGHLVAMANPDYIGTTRMLDQIDDDRSYNRRTEQRELDIQEYCYTVQAYSLIESSANYANAKINVRKDI